MVQELEQKDGAYEGDNKMGQILMEVRKLFLTLDPEAIKDKLNELKIKEAKQQRKEPVCSLPNNLDDSLKFVRKLVH